MDEQTVITEEKEVKKKAGRRKKAEELPQELPETAAGVSAEEQAETAFGADSGTESPDEQPAEFTADEEGRVLTRRDVLAEKAAGQAERAERNLQRQQTLTRNSALESIMHSGRIIEASVAGVEELSSGGAVLICASAFAAGGNSRVKLLIPYDRMYMKNIMDTRTIDLETPGGQAEYRARQKQMLTKMLGLTVPVCIESITAGDDGSTLILASRKAAGEKLRKSAFIDNAYVREGERYSATVISVSPHSLAVNYAGVEKVIPQAILSERFLHDLGMHYRVGDKIDFIAKNIRIDGDDVKMDFDTKSAELEDALARQAEIPLRTIARGTISRIYRAGSDVNIFAWLTEWELPAKIPFMDARSFGREPRAGDDVLLVITGYRRSGYLDARIMNLSGSTPLFSHY